MAEAENIYGGISEARLDEITGRIEMKWKESLFGIITIFDELSPEELVAFLNIVSKSRGKSIKFPQDVNTIIDFSVEYLASRGVDVSKRPGLQVLDSNSSNQGLYERAMSVSDIQERGRR